MRSAQIVRAGDYSDKGYAELAYEAVEAWRKPEWEGVYHE
jgi:sarcosine oxidase/L-pipecolate oxidase